MYTSPPTYWCEDMFSRPASERYLPGLISVLYVPPLLLSQNFLSFFTSFLFHFSGAGAWPLVGAGLGLGASSSVFLSCLFGSWICCFEPRCVIHACQAARERDTRARPAQGKRHAHFPYCCEFGAFRNDAFHHALHRVRVTVPRARVPTCLQHHIALECCTHPLG